MTARTNYGPVKAGTYYNILEEGFDYFKISCRGRVIFCPVYVFF